MTSSDSKRFFSTSGSQGRFPWPPALPRHILFMYVRTIIAAPGLPTILVWSSLPYGYIFPCPTDRGFLVLIMRAFAFLFRALYFTDADVLAAQMHALGHMDAGFFATRECGLRTACIGTSSLHWCMFLCHMDVYFSAARPHGWMWGSLPH